MSDYKRDSKSLYRNATDVLWNKQIVMWHRWWHNSSGSANLWVIMFSWVIVLAFQIIDLVSKIYEIQFTRTVSDEELDGWDSSVNLLAWKTVTVAQSKVLKCLRSQIQPGSRLSISAHVQVREPSSRMQNLPPNRYMPSMLLRTWDQTG